MYTVKIVSHREITSTKKKKGNFSNNTQLGTVCNYSKSSGILNVYKY